MSVSSFAVLSLAGLIAVAGTTAAVTPAAAATSIHLSDSAYLQLARCAGIAKGLGSDASAFDSALSSQEGGRQGFVIDRAEQVRDDAAHDARIAGPDAKAHLTAEQQGTCQALLSPSAPLASR